MSAIQVEQKMEFELEPVSNEYPPGNLDIRNVTLDERELRIYLDGVFDMTHYGHFRLFKQVKDKFPNACIVIGICSDVDTLRHKGQTLMNETERAESVGHCRWVDEVVVPSPWIITEEFLDENGIDYVAHDGEPYPATAVDVADVYDFTKKLGKFISTQRTTGISTTDLINRIVRRYNEFVLRNLNRGRSRHELNVSMLRKLRIVTNARVKKWIDDPQLIAKDFTKLFNRQIGNESPTVESHHGSESAIESHPPAAFKYSILMGVLAIAGCLAFKQYKKAT